MKFLHRIEDLNEKFQYLRPGLLASFPFPRYLTEFLDRYAADSDGLRIPLLAMIVQSDLELTLKRDPAANREVVDYCVAFPELLAMPAAVARLLYAEAERRTKGDSREMLKYGRTLPKELKPFFFHYNPSFRYRKRDRIEVGGQGIVYLADDKELGREVALKVSIEQDGALADSIFDEATVTAQLTHPAIVPVYGATYDREGRALYAMRYVDLKPLTDSIEAYHKKPAADRFFDEHFRRMISQLIAVARAIDYAHSRKWLHLDIKPDNILVGDYGESMVIDWGLAYSFSDPPNKPPSASEATAPPAPAAETSAPPVPAATAAETAAVSATKAKTMASTGTAAETAAVSQVETAGGRSPLDLAATRSQSGNQRIGGTLPYMSPEQAGLWLQADVGSTIGPTATLGRSSDIYSLGATLYHIIANRPPFVREPGEVAQSFAQRIVAGGAQHAHQVNSTADRTLSAIAAAAMGQNPRTRYKSAKEFAKELEDWQAGIETKALPWNRLKRVAKSIVRHWRRVLAGAVGVAVVSLALWWQNQQERRQDVIESVQALHRWDTEDVPARLALLREAPAAWLRAPLIDARSMVAEPWLKARFDLAWAAVLPIEPDRNRDLFLVLADLAEPAEYQLLSQQLRILVDRSRLDTTAGLKALEARSQSSDPTDSGTPLVQARVAAALASFQPTRPWTDAEVDTLAANLLRCEPRWFETLAKHIIKTPTLADRLATRLDARFDHPDASTVERTHTAMLLARLLDPKEKEDAPALWRLVGRASQEQLPSLLDAARKPTRDGLRQQFQEALQRYQKQTRLPCASREDQLELDRLAAATANLALCQWQLDAQSFEVQLLRRDADPRLRTELIHRFRPIGVPPATLLERAMAVTDSGETAALLLGLAQYVAEELPADLRRQSLKRFASRLKTDGDPELLAAVETLCRRWNEPIPKVEPPPSPRRDQPGWMVGTAHQQAPNHRLIVIPAPIANADFPLGAAPDEGFNDEDERLGRARVPRGIAIGACEVTREQFREFLVRFGETGEIARRRSNHALRDMDKQASPRRMSEPDAVCWINFPKAAAYCNWLSKQEGLEKCYPDDVEEHLGGTAQDPPDLEQQMLSRTGYRLPTEVELALAHRAGTTSPRNYGYRESYIGSYAVFRFDNQLGPSPPATRFPNPWGMFDTLGNVAELAHRVIRETAAADSDVYVDNGPAPPVGTLLEEGAMPATSGVMLRGGAHNNVVEVLRSAYRLGIEWDTSAIDVGFRVVRTLAEGDRTANAAAVDGPVDSPVVSPVDSPVGGESQRPREE
jgi:serine/threonine protein kinase/formylglycine-generating enzyme required for sulfatase activity